MKDALANRVNALITAQGEMAERIRAYDWAGMPLGPMEGWSETLLSTVNLMLHSPFPTILSWGPEMVFLYNDAAISTLSAKHPGALGGFYREVFDEAWDLVGADLEACLYRGETSVRDNMFIPILLNGVLEDHYWSYSLIPVYENGKVTGIYDAFRNMTETVVGAQRLRESEARLGELAAIVESSDDVIVSKDLEGTITSWNAAASRVFGYSAEEMIGASILKLIPEELHPDEKVILDSIRAGRRVEHFETVRLTKGGGRIDVSLTISPVRGRDGRVIGASKILRDISGRKRMEQSLLQAEKIAATGRMAATIAHEINNPLEAVMNLLYLLQEKIVDEEGQRYLAAAEEELGRVSHIAKQTLGYYREFTAASAASVSEIAEHALTIYGPRCLAAGIEVKKQLESANKLVLRRGEMMQVISNLIVNAIYATPAGGTLRVTVRDEGGGVALTVADDGVGIAAEDLPKVFDAFFTTRTTVGTGIGLFVAKQFVEGHGGRITIASRKGEGTTVRVFLPRVTAYAGGGG